jgi:pimeloyl-ACP methyl ester carboxylesterase
MLELTDAGARASATGAALHQTVMADGRALHFRRLGQGPAVVLLHESPRSSAVLLPLARALAPHFTVLALDTPGYGASDPLSLPRPEISDYADAIAASLRALGLVRVAIYGTHTGATIAAELARRHSGLVTGAVLDGFPVFTEAERAAHHAFYLPEFPPAWDGSHVARLWARVRDQYAFFPWYQPGRDTRLDRDQPPPSELTAVVRDFLTAGAFYATGYAASFRFDPHAALADAVAPLHLLTRADDLLFTQLDRLAAPGPKLVIERLGTDRAAWGRAVAAALRHFAAEPPPPPGADLPAAPAVGLLGASEGDLLVRCHGGRSAAQPPLLLLHDSPGGAWQWQAVAERLAANRQVIVPELPGHGRSPPHPPEREPLRAVTERLLRLADSTGAPAFDVAGIGTGAVVAHRLAGMARARVRRLVLVDPVRAEGGAVTERMPWIEPAWDGSHLMAAWWQVRDALLYRPWCDRRAAARRLVGPAIDVAALHRRFVSLVLADNNHLPLAHAAHEAAGGIFALAGMPGTIVLTREDPDAVALADAFRAQGTGVAMASEDTLMDRVAAILRDG